MKLNRIIKQAMKAEGSDRVRKLKSLKRRLLIRFLASLALTAALFSVIFTLGVTAADAPPFVIPPDQNINTSPEAVDAANPDAILAPNETSVLEDLIGIDASRPLEVLLLITVISVAPSILLMMTCFLRIAIVLSFLRNAMQTQQTPPNQVIIGLALFLTMFLMWPVFMEINDIAYRPYADGHLTTWEAVETAGEPLKTFMLKQTTNNTMWFFLDLADITIYAHDTYGTDEQTEIDIRQHTEITLDNYQEQLEFRVVIPAFMLSELSRAFQMGFLIFVPFLIIDIVVASTLMSMGMMMLPPAMISMPFKIMMFVLANGWEMIVGSILASFN